jgi:adenylyltransferase/sulfurtransferase
MNERNARYERQQGLLGVDGQRKLAASRVLVLGAGGLGSPLLYYLAAAGVGSLTVVDDDVVSLSNLNRQILYTEADLGAFKAERAAQRLLALNGEILVTPVTARFTEENGQALMKGCDLVALAPDRRETRLIANRLCWRLGIPLVDAAVEAFGGYVTAMLPGKTACLACRFGSRHTAAHPPQVLGATAGALGSMEALAVIELLLGREGPAGKMLVFDGLSWRTDTAPCPRREGCPVCGRAVKTDIIQF